MVGYDFKAGLTAVHDYMASLITIYDYKYGLSACFDSRDDHTALYDSSCGLSEFHDFRTDLNIRYSLSQFMNLGVVRTTSYDYKYGPSAGRDFWPGIIAIYDCRNGLSADHVL